MSGETDLQTLLASASPSLDRERYAFVTLPGDYGDNADLQPIAYFGETEGASFIVPLAQLEARGIPVQQVFRRITLNVHSSLEAVGLTAAVADVLTEHKIPANVVAGFYHDHIFVPEALAARAFRVLGSLGGESQ